MSWVAIARKDFRDAVRSYTLWVLSAAFVGVLALPPALVVFDIIQVPAPQGGNGLTTDAFVFLLRDTMTLFVPVIAIAVSYASIAGERDSGTLKLLLSLPNSRRDVVVGKALGRAGVVVVPVLVGFVVAAAVFLMTPVAIKFGNYVLFVGLTVLLGAAFVGLSIGISAAAGTGRRAVLGTVGIYVLFTLFWNQFANGWIRLLREHTGLGSDVLMPLHLVLKVVNPTQSYKTLVDSVTLSIPADATITREVAARVRMLGGSGIQGALNQQAYAQTLGESVPFYLTDAFVLVILLAWLAVPAALGYLAFREADL